MAQDWTLEEVEKLYALFRPTASANRGKTLLLADSDDGMRGLSSAQLQQKGFTVWSTDNALEALTLLKQRKPDCCILDINLQPLSGLDLLEALSREDNFGEMLVYLSSPAPQREDNILAQIYGAREVLRKPLQPAAVAEKIAEYFNDPSSKPKA